ncbi:MAG: RICIN domain-containing protein [Gemmataceae bacterium]
MNRRLVAVALFAGLMLAIGQISLAQPEPDQWYRIKNVRSKKVLSIGDDKEGQIIQRIAGPNEREQWKFVAAEKAPKHFYIINRKTGQALNVINESKEEGAAIIPWDASVKSQNQQWSLEKNGDHYVIKARHSGLVLDVADGTKKRKAPLIQYSPQNSGNQFFLLEPVNK